MFIDARWDGGKEKQITADRPYVLSLQLSDFLTDIFGGKSTDSHVPPLLFRQRGLFYSIPVSAVHSGPKLPFLWTIYIIFITLSQPL